MQMLKVWVKSMEEPLRSPPRLPADEPHWVVGGKVDAASVSLRFFGDELDPALLTTRLGGEPTSSCRKGDVRRGERYDLIEKAGSWRIHTERSEDQSVEAQINGIFDRLTDDLEVWREMTARFGGDLFCGIWLKDVNRGIEMSPQTLQRIAERGLVLGLDIYYVGDAQH